MSQVGEPTDRVALRARLARLQATQNARFDGIFEVDLIDAINHGRSWDSTDAERLALERSCISSACKQHFAPDIDQPATILNANSLRN